MFNRNEIIREETYKLVEAKSREIWTSEERKTIKKLGFNLNSLGEWKLGLPSDIGHIIINRIDGKIVLTFWKQDKYQEWKPTNIDKAEERVKQLVVKTQEDIDAKNNIYHFDAIDPDVKQAVMQLFKDIKGKFIDLNIKDIPRLILSQIVTQFKAQYDPNSLPIKVKIDLSDLLKKE